MFKDAQKQVDDWAQQFEEPYWPALSQFIQVTEEVGEVGRLINHMYGPKKKKASEAEQELGGELADVMFAVICIANRHGIDLDKAFDGVMKKITTRDAARFAKKN